MARTLRCLVLDDPRAVALGGEPVRVGTEVVGQVTSGGYLPAGTAEGAPIAVQVDGCWVEGSVATSPLYDPKGERIRADT